MADAQAVYSLLEDAGMLYERAVTPALGLIYYGDLKSFSNEAVMQMYRDHRCDPERGRYFPKPADLLAKAPKTVPTLPTADAAWAIAVRSFNEKDTVVWTQEIASARMACMPVWETGDKVGARMAFKASYDAILAQLPAVSIPKWQISAGSDPQARLDAVEQAQAAGLISPQQAHKLIPHYLKPITSEGSAIAGLLSNKSQALLGHDRPKSDSKVVEMPATNEQARKFRARVAKLKADLAESSAKRKAKESELAVEREHEEAVALNKRHDKLRAAEIALAAQRGTQIDVDKPETEQVA